MTWTWNCLPREKTADADPNFTFSAESEKSEKPDGGSQHVITHMRGDLVVMRFQNICLLMSA
jgi:hypothetical protein